MSEVSEKIVIGRPDNKFKFVVMRIDHNDPRNVPQYAGLAETEKDAENKAATILKTSRECSVFVYGLQTGYARPIEVDVEKVDFTQQG